MIDNRYRVSIAALYSLKYHFVWCPKYRFKVLVGPVEKRLRQLLYRKAKELDATIHALEIMPDHVHLLVESDPRLAPAHIAAQLLRGQHRRSLGANCSAVYRQPKDPCGRRLSIGYSRHASSRKHSTGNWAKPAACTMVLCRNAALRGNSASPSTTTRRRINCRKSALRVIWVWRTFLAAKIFSAA